MKQRAIYPGTFDPMTKGHLDIIVRAAHLFSELIVGVSQNESKSPFFSFDKRIVLAKAATVDLPNVAVKGYTGLLVDFATKEDVNIMIRGVRATSDVDYELQLARMNQQLCPKIETIFLTPSPAVMFVSASLVREIASHGGDIRPFVPEAVVSAFETLTIER